MKHNNKHNDSLISLVITPIGHMLQTPDGKFINGLVWTRVTDVNNEDPYVVAKIMINLSPKEK